MKIILSIPALVSVAGCLTYGLAQGKLAEIGKMAFVAGLAALLIGLR